MRKPSLQEKVYFHKETRTLEKSFVSNYAEVPHTLDRYNYHKEYELNFQIQNSGTRYVGDSVRRFEMGDLVLVGPNIPHYWKSDEIYYNNPELNARLVYFHFTPDFLGKDFFDLPEMSAARSLLERAKHGIHIRGAVAGRMGLKMQQLNLETNRWKKLTGFIEILNELGEAEDYELLASEGFCDSYHKAQSKERLTEIYNYIIRNHQENLTLDEVAAHANMNTSAFCRYFKKVTTKTFSQALNEIRVGAACRALINSELTVAEIGYSVGYQNIAYFNRQFKKIKGVTPQEYRFRSEKGVQK